jgi:hypothetical protein
MRVVSMEQNILVFSYVLITGLLVERVAEDFLPLMLDDHVQDFHWCMKIVKRDCSKISTSSLQSESFALPRDAWSLSKQAGLVVDYFKSVDNCSKCNNVLKWSTLPYTSKA